MNKNKLKIIVSIFIALFISNNLFAQKLKILNWSEYIDINILKSYVAKSGVNIEYKIYENNEELIKLLNSDESYDIIFPSSNYIPKLKQDELISKIDNAYMKNYKNIDPYFLNKENIKDFAIPYFWGTTAIIFDQNKINIDSFSELWDKKLKDKVFILDDMRDMFAISLCTLGYDINTIDEKKIQKAYEKLLKLIPNIKGFYSDSDTLNLDFTNSHAFASIAYNGDVANLIHENKNLKLLHPKEGAILWVDTIAINQKSKNKIIAYDFIDYLISKDISKQNAGEIGYALPNKDIKIDKKIYPNKKQQSNLKSVTFLGEKEKIYEKYWDKFLNELKLKGITNEE